MIGSLDMVALFVTTGKSLENVSSGPAITAGIYIGLFSKMLLLGKALEPNMSLMSCGTNGTLNLPRLSLTILISCDDIFCIDGFGVIF